MKEFFEIYNLENLITESTCFKSIQHPTSIDVILTNRYKNFHSSFTIETDLPDHHKMKITVLKTYYKNLKSVVISYRSCDIDTASKHIKDKRLCQNYGQILI